LHTVAMRVPGPSLARSAGVCLSFIFYAWTVDLFID
jgi:hypothetical protein